MLWRREGNLKRMVEALIPNYFFMDNKIYKKLRVVRSEDYIVVWSYADEARMRFGLVATRRAAQKAYKIGEVASLIKRPVADIISYVARGLVPKPSGNTYYIGSKRPYLQLWSEDDILFLRDKIFELAPKNKYGEPYTNFKLVSRTELLAKFRGDTSYYVQDEDGNMTRVWRAL